MIPRFIQTELLSSLKKGRVVGLFGARRTGKTVLMESMKSDLSDKNVLMVHGENLDVAEILSSRRTGVLKNFLEGYSYLFIDEAHKIPDIGMNLKLIVDTIPGVAVFISGSSSFDLKNKVGDPLTGRSRYLYLYPLAQAEMNEDYLQAKENLELRLIYGSYPQVITAPGNEEKINELNSIRDGYLLKDILELDNLKDSIFILNLLRLIAFQIGNDVSFSELASNLNVNKKTVMRYLDILEKSYVIYALPGFSRNLRKEYTKTPRYYFLDNGIRNALVANFNPIHVRDDIGKLWENYCMAERLKTMQYRNVSLNRYFWRTYDRKEIDLVEESAGKLSGYEFKWNEDKAKPPKDFLSAYPGSSYAVVNRHNYLDFISLL